MTATEPVATPRRLRPETFCRNVTTQGREGGEGCFTPGQFLVDGRKETEDCVSQEQFLAG